MSHVWRNWGRTESMVPRDVEAPATLDQLVDLVRLGRAQGRTVKAVGAGHSFSAIAVASDVMIDLSSFRGLIGVDATTGRATFGAGTRLHEIPALLRPHRLAMPNLGDIDRQTLAGATSTGTHGTGAGLGGISTQIVGATLVTGYGEILHVTDHEPDLLHAVALGLGALGVLVEITLQCVPAFALRAEESTEPVDEVLGRFAETIAAEDHFEFYWFPHTDIALTKTDTRLPGDTHLAPLSPVRKLVDDELLTNKLFPVLCELGHRVPRLVPPMSRAVARALSDRSYTDTSTAVLVSARKVRFREMEYAIPVEAVPDALNRVRRLIDRKKYRISFPIEVRAAAADDLMLSTAAGRASGYIAVHRYYRDTNDGYFDDVEHIMTSLGGRPHWGKMHSRDASYLRNVYPRFDEFRRIRHKLDPDRVFANRYLETVLGS